MYFKLCTIKTDLKTNSAEDTFRFYNELVNKAISKSNKVVLSLIPPSLAKYLNNKVQEMNDMIVSKFNREDKVSICYNKNFCINGVINENLFSNNTRWGNSNLQSYEIDYQALYFTENERIDYSLSFL